MPVRVQDFFYGAVEGRQVNKYVITEQSGLQASVINYGAAIVTLVVPDRHGRLGNVVPGFTDLEALQRHSSVYAGGICSRYANRIANGSFSIDGNKYEVTRNEGIHCLHGGNKGFDKVVWEAAVLPENNGVSFAYISKDGEEGFPGNLQVTVTYRIADSSLEVAFSATSDAPTPVNLTLHPYFNLSAGADATIAAHELQLRAGEVLEVDAGCIPTGKIVSVADSYYDFLQPRLLGTAIEATGGYDHCWVVNQPAGEITEVALLRHAASGRVLRISSTLPGIQLYTGQYLNICASESNPPLHPFAGLCLEPQFFPDSPNHAHFPQTILRPGQTYLHQIHYQFSTQ